MNKPLSSIERNRLAVSLADYFEDFQPIRRDIVGKHSEPYSKRDEGRNRRNERRQVLARKRSFLD